MPRFTPDPTKATFGFPVMPSGIFRVELGEPKSFYSDKGKINYGVRYPGKIISSNDHPELVGKSFGTVNCYQHTEGSLGYSKQVQAAALGCKKDDEFNEKFGDKDWSFNTDDASVGEGWHLMKGQVVDIECAEPEINSENGNLQTVVKAFRVAE